jgi:ParB family chromosome partitioning protein
MSIEEISVRIGKSVSSIGNTLRLLKLPMDVKEEIVAHGLKEGLVRPLVGMKEGEIKEILPRIVKENLSARDVEQLKVQLKKGEQLGGAAQAKIGKIEEKLGVKVVVRSSAKGSGSLVINFNNQAELKKIIDILA